MSINTLMPIPLDVMKRGGLKKKLRLSGPNINIKINIGEQNNERILRKRRKSLQVIEKVKRIAKKRIGKINKLKDSQESLRSSFPSGKLALRESSFVKLLGRSQNENANKIYTGNTFRVAENNPIFGGVTPRPFQPSTYTIPTTIQSGPLLGTYQSIFTPTLSVVDDFETKLKKSLLNDEFRKSILMTPKDKSSFVVHDNGFFVPENLAPLVPLDEKDSSEEYEDKTKALTVELSKTDYQNMYKKLYDENKLSSVSKSAFQNKNVTEQRRIIENFDALLPEIYIKYKTRSEAGEIKGSKYKIADKIDEIYKEWLSIQPNDEDERDWK